MEKSVLSKSPVYIFRRPNLLLIVLFLAPTLYAADWPMRKLNKQRTAAYEDATAYPPYVKKWQFDRGGYAESADEHPIIIGRTLYHYHADGVILAIDALKGTLISEIDVGQFISSELLYENGHFYFGANRYEPGSVVSAYGVKFNLAESNVIWEKHIESVLLPTYLQMPAVIPVGDKAYIYPWSRPCESGTLYCVSDATGATNWQTSIVFDDVLNGSDCRVAWRNDVCFVRSASSLYAIRNNAGFLDIKWERHYPEEYYGVDSYPVAANGKIYILYSNSSLNSSFLEALDEDTGSIVWRTEFPLAGSCSIGIEGSRIYAAVGGLGIYAVDDLGAAYQIVWHQPGGKYFYFTAKGLVYVDAGDRLQVLDSTDGEAVWTSEILDIWAREIIQVDGLIYVGGYRYDYCFGKPISLHLAVDKASAVPGDILTYTITLNSYGGLTTSLKLVETLPPEIEFLGASDGGSLDGSIVSWNDMPITVDSLREVTLTARVREYLPAGNYLLKPTVFMTYPGDPAYKDLESEPALTAVTAVEGPPAQPVGLVALDECEGVSLNWQPPPLWAVEAYKLYRSVSPGSGRILLATLAASSSAYLDSSAGFNQTYFYAITAISGGLESMPGNEVTVRHVGCGRPLVAHIRVFPNPFNPDKAVRGVVKFEVAGFSAVRVYTSRGLKVWEGESIGPGIIEWDGKNQAGKRVSPAVYLWVAEGEGWDEKGALIVE